MEMTFEIPMASLVLFDVSHPFGLREGGREWKRISRALLIVYVSKGIEKSSKRSHASSVVMLAIEKSPAAASIIGIAA